MEWIDLFAKAIAVVPQAIQGAESLFGQKSGAQKKAAAVEAVEVAVDLANAVSTKRIADSKRFSAGLGQIIDGVVECLNASLWAKP